MIDTATSTNTPESISKRNVQKARSFRSSYLGSSAADDQQRREQARELMEQRKSGKWQLKPNVQEGNTQFVNGKRAGMVVEEKPMADRPRSKPTKRNSVLDRASTFGQVAKIRSPSPRSVIVKATEDVESTTKSEETKKKDNASNERKNKTEHDLALLKEIMKSPIHSKRNSFGKPSLYSPTYSPAYLQNNAKHTIKNGKRNSNLMALQNPIVA